MLDLEEELKSLGYGDVPEISDLLRSGGFGFVLPKPGLDKETRKVAEAARVAKIKETFADRRRRDEFALLPWTRRSVARVAARSSELKLAEMFVSRLKKAGMYRHVQMICHGRDIPEDPAGLHRGITDGERAARMDFCVWLFVTKGWWPSRIADFLGYGFIDADVCAWLRGRNFYVAPDGSPEPAV